MWRILQVVVLAEENIISYNPCRNVENITSCNSCKDAEKYYKLWSLLIEGLQVVVAENRGRRLKE